MQNNSSEESEKRSPQESEPPSIHIYSYLYSLYMINDLLAVFLPWIQVPGDRDVCQAADPELPLLLRRACGDRAAGGRPLGWAFEP